MRTGDMIKCVTIDEMRYKNYKRRDQLPFLADDDDRYVSGSESKWASYSVENAVMLQTMIDLIDHITPPLSDGRQSPTAYESGVSVEAARYITSNGFMHLRGQGKDISDLIKPGVETWFQCVVYRGEGDDGPYHYMEVRVGTLAEVTLAVISREHIEEGDEITRLISVNVSRSARSVIRTGLELGIADFGEL